MPRKQVARKSTPEGSTTETVERDKQSRAISAKPETVPDAFKNALGDHYDPATLEQKQKEFEESGPIVQVITDEWYGKLEDGNPFEDVAREYVEANPDKDFRYLSELQVSRRGKRGYQEVRNPKTGEVVKCGTQTLAWIPKSVNEARRRKSDQAATDALTVSNERYDETARRAQRDSGGALEILPSENETFRGSQRVAS